MRVFNRGWFKNDWFVSAKDLIEVIEKCKNPSIKLLLETLKEIQNDK